MFIKSESDKQVIARLSAELRQFYPLLLNKPENIIREMLSGKDDEYYWSQYNVHLLQLKDLVLKAEWDIFLNKIRSTFESIAAVEDKTLLDPSFSALIQFEKNHFIKIFKSLIAPVLGVCYINYDLPATKMPVDQQLKYVNHQLCETQFSFVPNFSNAFYYSQGISEIAVSVYPGIYMLPPHLCQVEIDEIFYPGTSSVWDPTKTNLFYGLFGEPGV
ncbi:MAG TPA: hypothetical protein VK645_08835 [Chitinophagaceae bacterium]|nr:hypothetical protein [Chitinophagaceae bacterium]